MPGQSATFGACGNGVTINVLVCDCVTANLLAYCKDELSDFFFLLRAMSESTCVTLHFAPPFFFVQVDSLKKQKTLKAYRFKAPILHNEV